MGPEELRQQARLEDHHGLIVDGLASWMLLLRPLVAFRRPRLRPSNRADDGVVYDLDEVGPMANGRLSAVMRLEHRTTYFQKHHGVNLMTVATRPLTS